MKTWHLLIALLLTIAFGLALEAQTTRPTKVIYVPKVKGAPKDRIDGATRSGGAGFEARVVAPAEGDAPVSTDQPTFYWYVDRPIPFHCYAQVQTLDNDSVFEQEYDGIQTPGLIALDMSKGEKKLEAGKKYKFAVYVTVTSDPAKDYVTSKTIVFQPREKANRDEHDVVASAGTLASDGYFIDAVAALAKDSSADGKDALSDLIRQANLGVDLPVDRKQ